MERLPSVMQEHALLQTPTLSVLPTQIAMPFMEPTLLSVLLQATVSGAVVMGTATVKHPTVTTISALILLAMVGGDSKSRQIPGFQYFASAIELLVCTEPSIQTYHTQHGKRRVFPPSLPIAQIFFAHQRQRYIDRV